MVFHSYSNKCVFNSIEDIKDKHVTIMGLGLNGGGEAAVRFFLQKGAYVLVTDMKTEEQLKPTIDRLAADSSLDCSRLTYRLGEHRLEDFSSADCVIKNPGVKYEGNKYLAAAKSIESDLSIFLRFTDCPVIAVTGSKGKSSTVSAIYYGLKSAGYQTFLGGNITVSPLTFFDQVNSDTPVIIEFSSWQLSDLRGRGILKPYISIITKIVPDHQNWYGNMEDYVADKRLIYKNQNKGTYSIFDFDPDEKGTEPDKALHSENSWGDLFAAESKATVLRYSKKELPAKVYGVFQSVNKKGEWEGKVILPRMEKAETILKELSVPGEHMKTNVLNAALVMYLMGIPAEKIMNICKSWPGIDHRLQFFHQWKNQKGCQIKFYNDSCATVPEAAAAASQAFGKSVIFMTGGTDKGLELNPLIDVLTGKNQGIPVKALYLLEGSATEKLLPHLDKNQIPYYGPYPSLESLFADARKNLEELDGKEEVFVFSPGATSFGMFTNEFDRGNKYMEEVKRVF
ncbi:MAG: UDP-N-acetylmuramoyl-L-alanine--D-glutamate ligase [Treponema sp.]|nr:UDP-N-acetylmuramoyl-L-alanine--D-glutamate ligase [Treponema sp.]